MVAVEEAKDEEGERAVKMTTDHDAIRLRHARWALRDILSCSGCTSQAADVARARKEVAHWEEKVRHSDEQHGFVSSVFGTVAGNVLFWGLIAGAGVYFFKKFGGVEGLTKAATDTAASAAQDAVKKMEQKLPSAKPATQPPGGGFAPKTPQTPAAQALHGMTW